MSKSLAYRQDIDGIRALAVLAVVFFHAFPNLVSGGFIGVDVFFVISGFLISNLIFQQRAGNQFCWTTFYIKRINRLFPALILILLGALIAGYFLLFADEYQNLSKHILGAAFFLNNFVLWKETGYFDLTHEFKPLLHLWSLGIEEQFYLVWPALILLFWNQRVKPLVLIILIVVFSFLVNLLGAAQHEVAIFYLPFSRFWELGLGGIIAYTHFSKIKTLPRKISRQEEWFSFLSLSVLLFTFLYFKKTFIYPGWAALVPVLCTGILLWTQDSWINRNILTKSFLTLIGLISYPLYLWHWELLSFAHIILSGKPSNFLTSILVLCSFCFAWLTYYFIEKPIRYSVPGKKHAQSLAKTFGLLLFLIGGVALFIYKQQGLEFRALAQKQKTLSADMHRFEDYRIKLHPCDIKAKTAPKLDWCLQTHPGMPNKVIWGDSHADHLLPGFMKYDPGNNWLLLGQSSCPPLMETQVFGIGLKDRCAEANKIALQTILANPTIELVVLASLGPFYISEKGYAVQHLAEYAPSRFIVRSEKNTGLKSKASVFYHGFEGTISKLRAAGKKVVLFQDVPEIPFMPEHCLNRPLTPPSSCSINKKESLKRQKIYKSLLVKLKKKYPDILIFDPMLLLCPHQNCSLIHKDHLIYRDSHHLSIKGSQYIGKEFINWISKQA